MALRNTLGDLRQSWLFDRVEVFLVFRYIAFVWNPSSAPQRAAVKALEERVNSSDETWRIPLTTDGLQVFCVGDHSGSAQVHALPGRRGIIMGALFQRSQAGERGIRQTPKISERESIRIIETGGSYLVERYWGSYVAIFRDPSSGRIWIMRGPASRLPCLTTTFDGVGLYFSAMSDCVSLGVRKLTINTRFLARYLVNSRMISGSDTGLNEVSALAGGERLELHGERSLRVQCWDPVAIAGSDPIEDPAQAIRSLRDTTKYCVHAWASWHQNILTSLSGGLDSSVVLGCLQDAPMRPTITCFNYHSPGADSDERRYARLAAQRAGCRLVEVQRTSDINLEEMLRQEVSEKPRPIIGRLGTAEIESKLARECRATAIFSGERGDEVFLTSANFAAADYVYRHGIRAPLFNILISVAQMRGLSVWSVLWDALYRGLVAPRWDVVREAQLFNDLINADVVQEVQRERAPPVLWYRPGCRLPPGKQQHIYSLLPADSYYLTLQEPDDPEPVSPLMSQPLMELCLRIPTYLLTSHGWDRAIARQAFVGDVPEVILQRRSKGGVEQHYMSLLDRNAAFVRELLLQGVLVGQGLLNRSKIEELVSGRPSGVIKGMARIVMYLHIETWLQVWSRNQVVYAA